MAIVIAFDKSQKESPTMPARVKLMVPYNSLELAGFVKVPSGDNCWLLRVKSIYEAYQNQI